MIIVQLMGGLGNQLFEYAAARALAARRGVPLKLDISHYQAKQRPDELSQFSRSVKLENFHIDAGIATPQEIGRIRDRLRGNKVMRLLTRNVTRCFPRWTFGYYIERTCNFDPVVIDLPDNVYLSGYLQSEKYFKSHEALVRRELTFRDASIPAYAAAYVKRLRRPGRAVVAVHVRRGDLSYSIEVVRNPKLVYGPPVTMEYIRAAMARFDPDSTFLVFSDTRADLDWCAERLAGPNVHFSYDHSDLQDFALMQACDHNVISNSTFSWWAAWLNPNAEKQVITPKDWFFRDFYPDYQPRSLIPEDWTIL